MMKEHHRIAALVAVRNKPGARLLPDDVDSVACRLGPVVARDRRTGLRAYLHTGETPHITLTGRAATGEALSPARPLPRRSGASPRASGRCRPVAVLVGIPFKAAALWGMAVFFC